MLGTHAGKSAAHPKKGAEILASGIVIKGVKHGCGVWSEGLPTRVCHVLEFPAYAAHCHFVAAALHYTNIIIVSGFVRHSVLQASA